jgi:hypothetical protein
VPFKVFKSFTNVFSRAEWEPGLANITFPGLVFWGKLDPACPIEFADHLGKDTKNDFL